MRVSGTNPYDRSGIPRYRNADRRTGPSTALRVVDEPTAIVSTGEQTDVEIAVRLFADGGSISVKRSTVLDPDGTRRTVGIDALIK